MKHYVEEEMAQGLVDSFADMYYDLVAFAIFTKMVTSQF